MAKVKLDIKRLRLDGFSIVEVVVSTIVIIISFMLFSTLVGKLLTNNSDVSWLRVLYSLNFTAQGEHECIDVAKIETNCVESQVQPHATINNEVSVSNFFIMNKYDKRPLMVYHQIDNLPPVLSFFQ